METFFIQINNLLTTPPGNLIYHLVLCYTLVGAILSVQIFRENQPAARRSSLALWILLVAQLALFLTSAFVWQGLIPAQSILPPLDRAINVLSLIWLGWLWLSPASSRMDDTAAYILSLLAAIYWLVNASLWSGDTSSAAYNSTVFSLGWELTGCFIVLLCGVLLVVRRPNLWETGTAMMVILLIGYGLQVFYTDISANYAGWIRLASLAAYPLLLRLPQRFAMPVPVPATAQPAVVESGRPLVERRRYSADPRAATAFLELASETASNQMVTAITRAIGQFMLSDLCYLIAAPANSNMVTLQGGYDLIREEALPGLTLDAGAVPQISIALQKGKVLRWVEPENYQDELKELSRAIGVNKPGTLLIIPLIQSNEPPIGGILFFAPYSNRKWSNDDQMYAASITEQVVQILRKSNLEYSAREETEQLKFDLETTHMQMEQLRAELEQIQAQPYDAEPVSTPPISTDMADLIAVQQESQQVINRLQMENEQLQQQLTALQSQPAETPNAQMEDELRLALRQVAHLQNELGEANIKMMEMDKQVSSGLPFSNEQAEVIHSIAQELRQPMSSITGYTDLLLGESVGILGALQRKFLERVKASIERMRNLIDDLIQVTALDSSGVEITPETVDLNTVIDNAMAYTSAQFREKNIALRVDLPLELPKIQADHDALQQIVIHLLQNAGSATPVEGAIQLRVRTQQEDNHQYVLLQVTDSGGGIPAEDLPRVFSRLYRADNPLIEGVGDTGVGLSIAKTLVEAHGGRIWVDTEMGKTSTFSVLLPIQPEQSGADAKE
jgi:signal transduction histidine kinase